MLNNKTILITNDDGYNAEGIKLLVEEIYKYTNKIYVVAPKVQQSAVSHARTFFRGMTLDKIDNYYKDVECYALDGTPADCVRFGVAALNIKPDYVLSGINNGQNLGDDILYSGTCGAGFEACLMNYKSMCFSCELNNFKGYKEIPNVLKYIEENNLQEKEILNINLVPNPKGIVQTKQGSLALFSCYFVKKGDLWYATGDELTRSKENDLTFDTSAWENGYISITPLTIDRTKYESKN